MRLEEYCRFLDSLDRKLVWVGDVPFGAYRPFFYASLPRFVPYDELDARQAGRMLMRRALGVMHPFQEGNREIRFFRAERGGYRIESLHPKKRNQTRRGLENCEIRRIDWEQMRECGLAINKSALARQGRRSGGLASKKWWDRQCRVSSRFPDVLAWGCWVDGDATGYVHVTIHDDVPEGNGRVRAANVAHFMTDSRCLKQYPNEALIFTVVKTLMDEYDCAYVVLGSTSDDENLSLWKRHMGFREHSILFLIRVNPLLYPAKVFSSKLRTYI